MQRDKILEWRAVTEAYLYMLEETRVHVEQYLISIEEENEYIEFSETVDTYLRQLMEADVGDATSINDIGHVYPAVKEHIRKTALGLVRDALKDLLEDD